MLNKALSIMLLYVRGKKIFQRAPNNVTIIIKKCERPMLSKYLESHNFDFR